jgi:hypothetical protein
MLGPEFAIIGAPLAFAYALFNNKPSNCWNLNKLIIK